MRVFIVNFDYDIPYYDTLHTLVVCARDLEDAKAQVAIRAKECYYDNKSRLEDTAVYEEITLRGIYLEVSA